jgi:hypothetical protein
MDHLAVHGGNGLHCGCVVLEAHKPIASLAVKPHKHDLAKLCSTGRQSRAIRAVCPEAGFYLQCMTKLSEFMGKPYT